MADGAMAMAIADRGSGNEIVRQTVSRLILKSLTKAVFPICSPDAGNSTKP